MSTQVLIELRSVLTRKLVPAFTFAEAAAALDAIAAFEVVPADTNLVLDAHALARDEQLSWFDALIVEAAVRSRCEVLCSEDLTHLRRIASVTIRNPLLPEP